MTEYLKFIRFEYVCEYFYHYGIRFYNKTSYSITNSIDLPADKRVRYLYSMG